MKKYWLNGLLLLIVGSLFVIQQPAMAAAKPLPETQKQVLASPAPDFAPKRQYFVPPLWEVEMGARLWFSSGTVGAPQPLLNNPPSPTVLASRLRFADIEAYSGELFGRLDHYSGWFAKGFLGAGGIASGSLYDEDFPAGHVYSRTLSDSQGYLSYANLDLGRSLLRAADAKFGAFLGYNYNAQHINTTGCSQLAGASVCALGAVPPNYPGITEDDYFYSLRLGLNNQFMLTERLKLTGDVAYLPLVSFNGVDNHNARQLIGPEYATLGDGMMLELSLSYNFTNNWDLGLGGRYWAWNMRNGTVGFNEESGSITEPGRYNTERYGVFVQTTYHWDDKASTFSMREDPMYWKGLSFGGNLGGGWGKDQWSDPFNSTYNKAVTYTNVAGFGDSIHTTGPLGGVQLDYQWQGGSWVFGLGADANRTDFRGENICFSGLGGVNCQRIVTSLGTFNGQIGAAWDRSLIYVKGGGAWTNTTYNLNGNTNALSLNTGSTTMHTWGWTAGIGLDHALTNHWITSVEYDLIEIPTTTVSFSTVELVNQETIRIRQTLNLFKLGIKYKFDL